LKTVHDDGCFFTEKSMKFYDRFGLRQGGIFPVVCSLIEVVGIFTQFIPEHCFSFFQYVI